MDCRRLEDLDLYRCHRVSDDAVRALASPHGCTRLRRLNVAAGLQRKMSIVWGLSLQSLRAVRAHLPRLEHLVLVVDRSGGREANAERILRLLEGEIASDGAEETLQVATLDVTGPAHTHIEALKHLLARTLPAAVAA